MGWPTPAHRDHVRVNATLPVVEPSAVAGVLARYPGCRTVKAKVGDVPLADDLARIAVVRELLGAEGRIRVDANGGWTVDEAERAIHAFAEYDLEYVEQPCATVPELAELRRRVKYMGIPVAADESVRKAEDPLARGASSCCRRAGAEGAAAGRGRRPQRESRRLRGYPWWCPAPSTPRSASGWASRSRQRCPSSPSIAGSRQRRCSQRT